MFISLSATGESETAAYFFSYCIQIGGSLIFAEMKYQEAYRHVHPDLVSLLSTYFAEVQHGLQGDSWINITVEKASVDVDTFTSMKHQIKSDKTGPHVDKVIQILKLKYEVDVFERPQVEPHEEA